MSESSTLVGVRDAFVTALRVDPATVRLPAGPEDIPGWDSMGHLALIDALEKRFRVTFEIDEVMNLESVAAIVEALERKLAA